MLSKWQDRFKKPSNVFEQRNFVRAGAVRGRILSGGYIVLQQRAVKGLGYLRAIDTGQRVRLTGVTSVRAMPDYLEIEGLEGRLCLECPAQAVDWVETRNVPPGRRQVAFFVHYPVDAPVTLLLEHVGERLSITTVGSSEERNIRKRS